MTFTRALHTAALAAAVVAASGCGSSELRGLRNDIVRATPEMRVGDGMSLSLGPMSLGLARTFVRLGDDADAEMVAAALRSLRRVQFAQYDISGDFDLRTVAFPARLARYVDEGWTPAITVREADEVVWILFNDRVDEALMVTLSSDELVMAKLRGDLTEVARIAIAQTAGQEKPGERTAPSG